jgi:hypothetical protein
MSKPWSWWGSLDPTLRAAVALCTCVLVGVSAAPLLALPARVSELEHRAGRHEQLLSHLEAGRKFNTCAILALIEQRDPNGCVAFLPDPAEYIPPRRIPR